MRRFTLWLLGSPALVLGVTIVVAVLGVLAWRRLPIDAFPDVTNTQVMILAKAPGLAAAEVEQRVAYPIEQRMRGLPRVRQVRSVSRPGLAQVVIVFEDGAPTSAISSKTDHNCTGSPTGRVVNVPA